MSDPGRRTALAFLAATALGAAAPPAVVPLGGLLVLPGLAALFALCRAERTGLAVWLAGVAWMLWVSRSLVHVVGVGIVAIAALGAVYWILIRLWTLAGCRFGYSAPGFACGVAAAEWLRAHLPEIPYPHAQVCHALWEWPWALGPVALGGEPLANFLLAWSAAAAVVAGSRPSRALRRVAVPVGLWIACCGLVGFVDRPRSESPELVRVLALQSDYPLPDTPRGAGVDRGFTALRALTLQRLLEPAAEPPDLVLWPESAIRTGARGDPPRFDPPLRLGLPRGTRLVAGAVWHDGRALRAIAALCDEQGRLLDWHEKQYPVPAGERVPGLDWLPAGLREALLGWCEGLIGFRPDLAPGRVRPPLHTAAGLPFAALTCYDNAFDTAARQAVADGARLLCVLSNESWYGQGAELDQMLAMTVCRALETRTPVVRATVDGITCAVDSQGRVRSSLPRGPGQGPRDLEVAIEAGPGRLPPLAWLHLLIRVAILATGLGAVAHMLIAWGRLRPSRPGVDLSVPDPAAPDQEPPQRRS